MAGVGESFALHLSEEDQADGMRPFEALPAVEDAVRIMAFALDRIGAVTGGEPMLHCGRAEFLGRWSELRQQANAGEPLIVHFSGHGTQPTGGGALYLATAGGSARDDKLDDTCVSFESLLREAKNSGRQVLFLLDVCEAGQAIIQQQLADLASRRPQDVPPNVWIIGACTSEAATYGARFTTAAAEVLHQLADGDLDVNPTLSHVPVETVAAAIDRYLAEWNRADRILGQSVVRSPHVHAVPDVQPFFPNPAHTSDPGIDLLTTMNPRLREFALSCAPNLDPLHFATRAAGNRTATAIHFSGRHSQLRRIQEWTYDADGDHGGLLVVTGGPGSGKSALLGVTACLLHPELAPLGDLVGSAVEHFEPRVPATVLAVHARQLNLHQVIDSLWQQLHDQQTRGRIQLPEPPDRTALLEALQDADDVLVILDALDEATEPAAVLNEFLLPLVSGSRRSAGRCRVLIGTRPWWDVLPALHRHLVEHPAELLDLDPATEDDRRVLADDLDIYLRKVMPRRLLPRPKVRQIAEQLATYSDHGAFLVAALYADHLRLDRRRAEGGPPRTITEVFDIHINLLTRGDRWMRPVLEVLGQARGQGMPLNLIHEAALAHQPPAPGQPTPQLADTRRVIAKATFYLRATPGSDHRLLYRYFHEALAEHTRAHTDPATIYNALTGTLLHTPTSTSSWAQADPYLLRHAAEHSCSVGIGAVDQLLEDPQFLLHAEPDTLSPYLHRAISRLAIHHAHIYRTTTSHHSRRHQLQARRDLLALDAAVWHNPRLAHLLATTPVDRNAAVATPRWATNSEANPARVHTLTGNEQGWIYAAATLMLDDGRTIAVTGDFVGALVVWDLATGERLRTIAEPIGTVRTVALGFSSRGPAVLAGNSEGAVIGFDLDTGEVHHFRAGPAGDIRVIVPGALPGRSVAITCNDDGQAIVWDLITGEELHVLTGANNGKVGAVAVEKLADGQRVAVTCDDEGCTTVWDLATGERLRTLTSPTDPAHCVATTVLPDGRSVAVTVTRSFDAETLLRAWDLKTGDLLHTATGPEGWVYVVAVEGLRDGRIIAVTGGDGQVLVWDLTSGEHRTFAAGNYPSRVNTVAITVLPDGRAIAVTGDTAGRVLLWDLALEEDPHILSGHSARVRAVAVTRLPNGRAIAVAIDSSYSAEIQVRDLKTGDLLSTFSHNTLKLNSVAVTVLPDGRAISVAGDDQGQILMLDLATGDHLHTLTDHGWFVTVAAVVLPGGRAIAISGGSEGRVLTWDVATGEHVHTLTGHTGWVCAVAAVVLPGGRAIAISGDFEGRVLTWDAATGEHLHSFSGHNGSVNAVAATVLPDGRAITVTGDDKGQILMWDLATGCQIRPETTMPNPVGAIAATSDGMVVGYGDEVAHFLWATDSDVP
ncbi:hypothetical protein ACGFX4_38875 [Kitasatospora sp. NPDC048365]|uniref:hypothetical protein n=1 Tax=Kitasatospora sp. NPDC048365 TaxID=3364050 RepID=UPI003713CD0B